MVSTRFRSGLRATAAAGHRVLNNEFSELLLARGFAFAHMLLPSRTAVIGPDLVASTESACILVFA